MVSPTKRSLTAAITSLLHYLILSFKAVHTASSFVLFPSAISFSARSPVYDRSPLRLCSSPDPDTMTGSQSDSHESSSIQIAKHIKAVIFDMDGTLLDTEILADRAILQAVFGGDDPSCFPESIRSEFPYTEWRLPWELKKKILGMRGCDWAPIILNHYSDHFPERRPEYPTADELIDLWEKKLNAMCSEIEACPGAKEFVNALASSSNSTGSKFPMAIATSSRMGGVVKKRTRHEEGMFEHMDEIVTGDDPEVKKGKPAPDIYLLAARRLGVDPTDCLVFEDALTGVKSGKAAGCMTVAVPDPRFSEEDRTVFEKEGKADVILTSLWEFDGRPYGIDLDMKELLKAQQQYPLEI